MLPHVLMNLDFAASVGGAPPPSAGPDESKGAYLLIGTGCWLLPLLATLFAGVR